MEPESLAFINHLTNELALRFGSTKWKEDWSVTIWHGMKITVRVRPAGSDQVFSRNYNPTLLKRAYPQIVKEAAKDVADSVYKAVRECTT